MTKKARDLDPVLTWFGDPGTGMLDQKMKKLGCGGRERLAPACESQINHFSGCNQIVLAISPIREGLKSRDHT